MSLIDKLLMVFFLCGAIYLVYRAISKQAGSCSGNGPCKHKRRNCKNGNGNKTRN